MKAQPLITVLLPVYNAQAYVARAIESILQQEFQDFELLILNDGFYRWFGRNHQKFYGRKDSVCVSFQ